MSRKITKKRSLLINGEELIFELRRSKRAKNILLKINISGDVEVVVPWYVSYTAAEKFVIEQALWLQKNVAKKKRLREKMPRQSFANGTTFPILGDVRQLLINIESNRTRSSYKENGDYIEVSVTDNDGVQKTLERWYRARAQQYFDQRVMHYEKLLGVSVNKVVVSGARTQWGSCMRNKSRVSLQWRLAQAPLHVVDYVIVHEVMHLKVKGHNNFFWSGVQDLCPEYNQCRAWLRDNGQRLYW